jgi:hypothetical protein
MNFPLIQLYVLNRSKPIVEVEGIDGELQWDYCNLEGLPPEREGAGMYNMGKVPKGQYDNLPKTFYATTGAQFFIAHIHTLRPKDPKKLMDNTKTYINEYGDDDYANPVISSFNGDNDFIK